MINYYGTMTRSQIEEFVYEVAVAFGKGDEDRIKNSIDLMLETLCAETRFGAEKDNTATTGVGISQFDPIAIQDIQENSNEYRDILWNNWNIDFDLLHIEQARYGEPLSIIFMRMKYARIEEEIPNTREKRASYWLDNYNVCGAGTLEHYLDNSKLILDTGTKRPRFHFKEVKNNYGNKRWTVMNQYGNMMWQEGCRHEKTRTEYDGDSFPYGDAVRLDVCIYCGQHMNSELLNMG